MKKWTKALPIALQLGAILSLVLAGVAGFKWGS